MLVTAVGQPGDGPAGDEAALLAAAGRILHGYYAVPGTTDSTSFLWHGPGMGVVLAPLTALDLPLVALRFVDPLILFAGLVAFHRLLLRQLRPRAALVGAYAFGLYLPFYEGLPYLHKEPLAVLLVTLGLLWTSRYLEGGRRRALVVAGLAFGGLAMVRVEYGWVIVAAVIAGAVWWVLAADRTAARRTACVAGAALAACTPWLFYTYDLTGHPLYWGSSGGSSLYWMSPTGVPGQTGQWHSGHSVFSQASLAAYRPLFAGLQRLTPLERDQHLRAVALANIGREPALYVRNLGLNFLRLWFFEPRQPSPPMIRVLAYAVVNAIMLMSLAWSAVVLVRKRGALPRETLPFAAFAVASLAGHAFTSAEPRLALPAIPALMWLVACAVSAARHPRQVPLRLGS